MPPFHIDGQELFAAIVRLANENDRSWRFTRKGDKRPWQDIEAQKVARRKTIETKQRAAAERAEIRRQERMAAKHVAPGQGIADRMLRAMEPQAFYGMGDLIRMIGESRTSRSKVIQMWKQNALERVINPAWRGEALNPWEIMAGADQEPQHLYCLTEKGLKMRANLVR